MVTPRRQTKAQESIGRQCRVKLKLDENGLESGVTPADTCLVISRKLSGL